MNLKELLNKEQYEAASTIDGPVLILAGAGSGKTRVLTHRIAYMIEDLGIWPSQILAITFTNKASKEMKDRVKSLVSEKVENMWISTFHSSCVRILRREIEKLGYNKNFAIYDSYDQKALVKQCMKELNINDKDLDEKEIINKIGGAKDNLISADEYKKNNQYDYRKNKVADVYLLYQKKLKANNALDFDDLIFKTVELFKNNREVLEFYQRKFKYIMVDEYQDTNKCQYEFVRLLAASHKNICVVGDDDQCLVEGTTLKTESGETKVEEIMQGDKVLTAAGQGEIAYGEVDEVSKKEYEGTIIKVTTESGKVIKSTPNHITFAKVNTIKDNYYVYLMYKKNLGYRIGQTSALRSRKQGYIGSGLAVRLNGEKADKMWILKVCKNKSEASYYEQYFAAKYGLPTVVFSAKDRRINLSQDQINKLFKEINTIEAAEKLMEENFLSSEYPHHFSTAVIRGNSIRKIVNLSFFSGRKAEERKYYSHRIALNTSGEDSKKITKDAGFPVRDGQRNTWRVETERVSYDDAESYGKKLAQTDDVLDIIRKAKLTKDNNFFFMPMGSIRETMSMAVFNGKEIIEEKVVKVETEQYKGFVYDISVPNFRQYVADNMVVHNCIYQWRGADIKNILDFEKDYPNAKIVKLEQNYRSKGNILNAANEVIKRNAIRKNKVLRTESDAGEKIKIYRAYSDLDEAQFVGKQMENLIDSDNRSYKDFAILYRTNAQSRVFEDILRRRGIPYRIVGGLKFYDRKEIKDILAYLKLINNPVDDISLKRIINVPKRSIGEATVLKVQEYGNITEQCLYSALLDIEEIPGLTARNINSLNKFIAILNNFITIKDDIQVSDLIGKILDETGYMDSLKNSKDPEDASRIENLKELVSAAVEFEHTEEDTSLFSFLEKVALVSDIDNFDEDADSIVMMTVHSAKGLEFPVVFMVGMENGIFPGNASFDNNDEMEESRRLCYVGITRAKESLYMTSAERRRIFGHEVSYGESDFVSEIPESLKENVSLSKNRTAFGGNPQPVKNFPWMNQFKSEHSDSIPKGEGLDVNKVSLGIKVKHPKFGVGTIVKVDKENGDAKLTIAFVNQGIKILMLSMAPLEIA